MMKVAHAYFQPLTFRFAQQIRDISFNWIFMQTQIDNLYHEIFIHCGSSNECQYSILCFMCEHMTVQSIPRANVELSR